MRKTRIRALVLGLLGVMAGVASAEVIYIDFYDDGTVNSSPETYNVWHSTGTNGPSHPLAEGNGGLSMSNLVDTASAATTVAVELSTYNDDGETAAGGGNVAIGSISGVATNATGDAFWCNDKGTPASDFGFVLTFTNLTGDAYDISLVAATTQGGGAWSVTTGAGDASVHVYTSAGTTTNTIDWTSVVPADGAIQLTSVNTAGGMWRNAYLAFASLEAVTVSGAPPIADNISTNVTEDGSVNITLSGTDPDGGGVTYHVLTLPANGTLTTNGALPDVTYTPETDFVGSDSFTYFVNDGDFDSAPATVSITVDPGSNDTPVADDISVVVAENGSVDITLSGSDPEGSNLTYNVSQPADGTLTTNGALPDVTYTPDPDFFGSDSFTYTVNDGELDSLAATVSVSVIELPDGEYVINGDFEFDGYTTNGLNNQTAPIAGWTGPYADGKLRYDTTSNNNEVPGAPNTVIRLLNGTSIHQNFNAGWASNDTFTVSLNACEVWWKSNPTTQLGNGIWVSLRGSGGSPEYQAQLIDLDGTHGGSGVTYATWQSNQTFSLDFACSNLVAGGATENDELRLNIFSKSDPDSINWIDNVSVNLDRSIPTSVGDISIEVISGGTEVALSWPTAAGWNYGVEACDDLSVGIWDNIITGVEGTGGEVTVTNPVSPDTEFYRAYLDNE